MIRIAVIALTLAMLVPASASTVVELGPAALEAGAERIVDARVISRSTVWNATRSGLETHALLAVATTRKGPATQTLELVVPGGELDGARHVIVGMPAIVVGEQARWFLRARGDGRYRVYGWAQGKWPARVVDHKTRYAPAPIAAEHDPTIASFTTNGMVWPAAKIPVQYLIQNAGSQDLALADEIAAIDAAFASWQAVATSSLTFQNAGMTDLGQAVDDTNVMLFVESGWQFGSEAAAATSLFIIDGQQTADIAVNGENFTWAIGPPSPGITSNVLDLQAVMTHEIGHFSGLGHTTRSFDTMYFSWKPWQGQRTLSIDDKLGLSSIYPTAGNECTGSGCPAEETCTDQPLGRLCAGTPDPVGAPCNYDRVECDAFCLFTAVNLSTGYCSKFCDVDADCPLTHHCEEASAGTMPVKVCFVGAQPPCMDAACPAGQHCDAVANACTFECRTSEDCEPGSICDAGGSCIAGPPVVEDDGGCRTGGEPALFGLVFVWLATRRRRVTACRRSA
jgi:hypothetical protein